MRLLLVAFFASVCNIVSADDITLSFPDDNSSNNKVSSYTETWTATKGNYSWSISNFNNNKWSNWTYIRCGVKKTTKGIASITTSSAISEAVSSVVVTIKNFVQKQSKNNGTVDYIQLTVASDADFTSTIETVKNESVTTEGDVTFNITTPTANCYYKLEFCYTNTTSNNGVINVSQVVYKINSSTSTCKAPTNLIPADGTVYKATDNNPYTVSAKAPDGDNYSVEYSTDQTNWSSKLSFKPSDYATAGTLTVYARTKDTSGSLEPSPAISATYSITSDILDGFSALRSKIIEDNSTSEKTYYVEHSKLYVTRGGGNNYYMQDADAGILLFKCNETVGTSYEEGLATVKGCYYGNALVELTSFTTTGTKGTYTDSELSPKVATLSELSEGKYEGMLVKVRKVIVNTDPSTNSTTANTGEIADNDGNTFVLYEPGTTKPALTEKSRYNIVGIPGLYYNSKTSESTKELMLYREADATLLGEDVTLTISPSGYSSLYYSDRNLALPEGVKGYVCSYTEGSSTINATKTYYKDNTSLNAVPKDCAVILEGTANTAYTLEAVDDDDVVSGKDDQTNILKGTDANESITAESGYLYFFGYNSEKLPGFIISSDGGKTLNNGAHKTYIEISYDINSSSNAKALVLDFGNGSTTNINSAAAAESISDGKIFTIEGVQVSSKNLKPGLYIKNGRKFIVR